MAEHEHSVRRPATGLNEARFGGLAGRGGFLRVVRSLPAHGRKDELLVFSNAGGAGHGTLYFWDDTAKAWTAVAQPGLAGNHNILSTTHPDALAASVVRGAIVVGNSTPAWSRLARGVSGTYLRSNGADLAYSAILDADVPTIHSGSAHHGESHTLASHSAKAHGDLSDAPASAHHTKYTDAEAIAAVKVEHAIALGKAGVVAAAADTANFIQVAPFDMKLTRLKATCIKKPTSDATIQVRQSTDSGATFANAFGTVVVTAAGTAKIFTSNPADLNINESDGFNFSVTGGADGEDYMIEIIGEAR